MPSEPIQPHVLMLIENNPYPQDTRVRAQATALLSFGCRVSVICPARPRQTSREEVDGVTVYRFPPPFEARGFLSYVWEYLYSTVAMFVLSLAVRRRSRIDVIHAANPSDTLVFIAAVFKLFGTRFVFDHHDLSPELYRANCGGGGSKLVYRALLFLERLSCRAADRVIATNESYKRIEMARDAVPEERITIVRNGPDLVQFEGVQPCRPADARGRTLIAYVGAIGWHDGLDCLLRVMHHLKKIRSDYLCCIIGSGEALPDLRRMVETLGLQDCVRFTGWLTEADKLSLLASADICVDPDPYNPFNDASTMIKVAEYMALEKPVVGFALRENQFTAQDAGLFVAPDDERAFARAIAKLMDDPEQRLLMGQRGRRRVESVLAWSHSSMQLLSAYQKLLPHARLAARAGTVARSEWASAFRRATS